MNIIKSVVACSIALGLAAPALAQSAQDAEQNEVELDTLKIEDRTADVNPYAEPGAPYKARVSGDARRVKPLAETPATITVLTESRIEESGLYNLREILDSQPGVTLGSGEGGNQFGDRYIIRGQEARSDVFVDGLRDAGLAPRETFAIEQIEITKGPSATFAGRGASGGAVNSISKQASLDYNFHNIEVTGGTNNLLRTTLDSNFRLSDQLAVRANLLFNTEELAERDPARRRRYGAALAVNGKLSDRVSVLLDYYHLTVRDRMDLGGIIANSAGDNRPYNDIPPYAQKDDFSNATVHTVTGRIRVEMSDSFTLENATRYGTVDNGFVASQVARFNRGPNDPVAPGALDYRVSNTRSGWQESEYFADRLNITGSFDMGGLKHNLSTGVEYTTYDTATRRGAGVTGAYGFTATGAFNCISGTGTALNAWCLTDGAGNLLGNRETLLGRTGITKATIPNAEWKVSTLAGYVLDSIDVTDWLTIDGGIRFDAYDYDLKILNTTTGDINVTNAGFRQHYRQDDTLWNYNAGVTLKPTDNGIVYFAYSTGSTINGGESDDFTNCGYGGLCSVTLPDGTVVFQTSPEKSENFEFGTKWNLFDGKLLATAALFRTEKSDLMQGSLDNYSTTGSLNSGKIRVEGIELGLAGNITSRLSGQVGAAFMKSKVLESIVPAEVGRRLANFANNSVDAQLRYEIFDGFVLGGTVTYQSEMFAGQADSAAQWNDTSNTYNARIPGHTIFGAFASYKINDNFTVRVNGINLGDKIYYTAAYRSGQFASMGDRRSVRVTLSGKF